MRDALNTPAQILLNHLRATFTITGNVPLYYEGVIAGSEFLTYAATKLYLALQFGAAPSSYAAGVAGIQVTFYSSDDAIFYVSTRGSLAWNATGAALNYEPYSLVNKNFYFSRLNHVGVTYIKFIGYRITRT